MVPSIAAATLSADLQLWKSTVALSELTSAVGNKHETLFAEGEWRLIVFFIFNLEFNGWRVILFVVQSTCESPSGTSSLV